MKNNIKRENYLEKLKGCKDSDSIKVLTGIRRCGKTSLLYSWADELEKYGINKDNIIFISIESPKYSLIETNVELEEIIYEKTEGLYGKIYLILDEIQEIDKWDESIIEFKDKLDCDIYISGSNSEILSDKLKCTNIEVYPFSFKEILQYKQEIENIKLTEESINSLFDDYYVNYGGMPTVLPFKNNESRLTALNDIFDSILLNGIISKYNMKNIDLLKRYVKYLMESIGETFSYEMIKNYLESNDVKTTQNTLLKYNNYLQETFFISKCKRYDFKCRKMMKIKGKNYLTDHGFHNALIEKNSTTYAKILENIVYVELLRRGYAISVGRLCGKNKMEVDFVCEKSKKYVYIQVADSIASEEAKNVEFKPFFKIPDKYDTYIITTDIHDYSYKGVKHINIIDFLLGDEIA